MYLKTFYVVKFFPPSNMKCILIRDMKNFLKVNLQNDNNLAFFLIASVIFKVEERCIRFRIKRLNSYLSLDLSVLIYKMRVLIIATSKVAAKVT